MSMYKSFVIFALTLSTQLLSADNSDWTQHSLGLGPNLLDAEVLSAGEFAIVGSSYFITSRDNGDSWQDANIEVDGKTQIATTVSFPFRDTGYVSGSKVLRTTDGGRSWSVVLDQITDQFNRNSWFNAMSFPTSKVGRGVGPQRTLLETTDGGESWHSYVVYCHDCNDVYLPSDSTGYFGGSTSGGFGINGLFADWHRSEGQNYAPVHSFFTASYFLVINKIFILDEDHWWVAGRRSRDDVGDYRTHMVFTTDGGGTWEEPTHQLPHPVTAMVFLDESRGFVGTSTGQILRTEDGGRTWVVDFQVDVSPPIYDLVYSSGTVVAACGGSIIRVRKIVTSVSESTSNTGLDVQLFPNPSDGIITVELPATALSVEIFDSLGRIQRRSASALTRHVFNTSELAAGTYMLRAMLSDQRIVYRTIVVRR